MGVSSLPKTVTQQRRGCDLNPGPSAPEFSTLTLGYRATLVDLVDLHKDGKTFTAGVRFCSNWVLGVLGWYSVLVRFRFDSRLSLSL